MMPFVADFEVFWVARRRGLAKGTTMADLAADVADALAARFSNPLTYSASRPAAVSRSNSPLIIQRPCVAWR